MKQIVFAAAAALGVTAIAAPAQALQFRWNVDYTGFFADDATISGSFVADETAADDGFVSGDEFDSWVWNWSGNSEVEAFTISSSDGEVEDLFGESGFYVDGTANEPMAGADQGLFVSDDYGLDLEFLIVEDFTMGTVTFGDATTGTISVSDPEKVPEPATILGLLTLAGGAAVAKRKKQAA